MFNNYYSKMHDKYNIDSILNAINEINIKSKKTNVTVVQNSIPKLNQDLKIPLDLDRLIQEAEKHKKKKLLLNFLKLNLKKTIALY